MNTRTKKEEIIELLNIIQAEIVQKDPDDNDKFLRDIWELVSQAKDLLIP